MASVGQLVQAYSYPVILLGTVLEGEPVMLFGGFAAHRGSLELIPWVILAGAVGKLVGYQAWLRFTFELRHHPLEHIPIAWNRRL